MIELEGVGLTLGNSLLFSNLSLSFKEGQKNLIVGPSGSGKSTLLRILAGLVTPQKGQVRMSGQRLGFVFQEPRLLPWLTLKENIALPLSFKGQTTSEIDEWLHLVGLQEHPTKYPHELSGGMRMRAAIARALIIRPQVLLMDEPFAALDEIRRQNLQDLLCSLQKKLQLTLIFVTHSLSEAVFIGDYLFILKSARQGIVVEQKLKSAELRIRDDQYFQSVQEISRVYQSLMEENA